MSSYLGRHAELYDLFYADKPYVEEAAFVLGCIERHVEGSGRRLLELACGTGGHALLFAERGYDVVATDYSESMLAAARQRGSAAGARVDFRLADMRSLAIAGGPFDAVVCLFDSIGYVATNEAIATVLRGVHAHLRPGGVFVFEFWHAPAMLRGYSPTRVRRWRRPGAEIIRISETVLAPAQQLARVTYTILELGDDGRFARLEETQTNRYFLVEEMSGMLARAELLPVAWHAGFTSSEVIELDTWHVVGVARRASGVPA